MKESWRWYGAFDDISLHEIAQTGASGIVSALHGLAPGEVWPEADIRAQQQAVARAPGLDWCVVESLPVHEAIKSGEGDLAPLFATYRQSMANLAACGIRVICYNFMPLLDWTRTDLAAPLPRGGTALRFDSAHMAAFEIHMLERPGAEADYGPGVLEAAKAWAEAASAADRETLLASIMAGLPGKFDRYDIAGLRGSVERWKGIGRAEIRASYARFLQEVVPAAEDLGVRLCVHPDDPPRDILGLPRVVSSEEDIAWIMDAVDSPANGLTLCTGSLGAGAGNVLPAIARRFAPRIHFAHLRNVAREPDGSFQESAHLAGDVNLPAVIAELLTEEARRRTQGRADAEIPFRPDHGHALLSDLERGSHPGYPLLGRMRGLAELRGVIAGLRA